MTLRISITPLTKNHRGILDIPDVKTYFFDKTFLQVRKEDGLQEYIRLSTIRLIEESR